MSEFITGLNHLALKVPDLEKATWYFKTVLQCSVNFWREDELLVTLGTDLIVLKKTDLPASPEDSILHHYGFMAQKPELVDKLYLRVKDFGFSIWKVPYDRSDGRGFYFYDPFGNLVEYFWLK